VNDSNDIRLPREDEKERDLIGCVLAFPERAGEILPLCRPTDFFEPLLQQLWRQLVTQWGTMGRVDCMAAARKIKCAQYVLEIAYSAPTTTAYAECLAEAIKLAARGRHLYEVLQRGADAILRGRPADAVLAQVQLALEPFEAEAIGA